MEPLYDLMIGIDVEALMEHAPQIFTLFTLLTGASLILRARSRLSGRTDGPWSMALATITRAELTVPAENSRFARLDIQYSYEVRGRQYQGSSIYVDPLPLFPADKARELYARFREGTQAQVYYRPDHPESACLQKVSILPPLVGQVMVAVIAVWILMLGWFMFSWPSG